ncbi:MAG: cupin [Gammaproteobacteria bacterium RIFCSPHIGHO2_12_FULL_42_13]|nr:MAG: cupin [Gammaproteobacteria bacterium RIFCSPHIGHO2_12_FULL_42_13]
MMNKSNKHPLAMMAVDAPARTKPSVYPEPFATMMAGREKRPLGDIFGIKNFGVNLTQLAPGSQSALLHKHNLQEEFIFILEGQPTLVTEFDEIQLHPGMCAGFTPDGSAHQLINRTSNNVVYLEIGDRTKGDEVSYPADDLVAVFGSDSQWHFTHKNGKPY